ncbi:MAG: response regulator, partial [Proteobacteria bacterium]|nr:response regulator [Pseudomonadota bacterium]
RTELDGVPPVVRGDRTRLAQALVNYLDNAAKFTSAGSVTLRCRLVGEPPSGHLVRFEVTDTGIGLTAEQQGRVFQAFVQGDASTTREYGGTGLGLAITRRIAELMGGEAGVGSVPGEGSTFWLTARLGRARCAAADEAGPDPAAAEVLLRRRHSGARVLLVEDEPLNREVALMMLEDVGLVADVAVNGVEAVQRAATEAYAAILMDMQMPQMDGLQATRAIRALPGGAATPIIALTANAFIEDRDRCLEAGMNDFLAKPFEPAALFAALLACLGRAPVAPPTSAGPIVRATEASAAT